MAVQSRHSSESNVAATSDDEKDSLSIVQDSRPDAGGDYDLEKQGSHGGSRTTRSIDRRSSIAADPNAVPVPSLAQCGANGGVDRGEEEEAAASVPSGVLGRIVSRVSTKSSWNPGPPPDGGARAWLTVLCAHLVIMNTWGFINAFGLFQAYYVDLLARPPADISWIGSFQVFLLFFIGTFTGRLTDAGYFHILYVVGTLLQAAGLFGTSACTQYWQFFVAQGVCMGLGNGFLFCPTMAVVSTYWARRRAFAIGIVACGSATGGLIYPAMVRQLLPTVGFGWTMRALGFVQVATMVVAGLGIRPRVQPRKTGRLIELPAFKEAEYSFYAAGSFFSFLGIYVAFFYIASYARDVVGMSYASSLDLILVISGVGAVGRVVPNYFADRVGPINLFIVFSFASGLICLCWMTVTSLTGLYVWTVFYGVTAGGIQSLFPAGLTSLTTDLRKAGVRMGMIFTLNGIATLMGPPIAGAIVSAQGGKYNGAQGYAGTAMVIGSGFMVAARFAKGKKDGLGLWAKV